MWWRAWCFRPLGGMPRWPRFAGCGARFPCWASAICWQRACALRCRKRRCCGHPHRRADRRCGRCYHQPCVRRGVQLGGQKSRPELKKKYTRTLSLCPPPFALFFHRTAVNCAKQEVMRMKHRWTTLLWELWAAQALCAVAALPPGSGVPYMPGTGAAGAGPCGGGAHGMGCVGLLAEPPDGLPPEQLLEQAPGFDFATCAILSGLLPCPEKRAKQKPLCRGNPVQRFCSSIRKRSSVLVSTLCHTADLAAGGVLFDDTLSASLVDRGNQQPGRFASLSAAFASMAASAFLTTVFRLVLMALL